MIGRLKDVVLTLCALSPALPAQHAEAQAQPGPPQLTTCSTPFHPVSGLTFHAGYKFRVVYHTFPYQFGYATYSGDPNPAEDVDGLATWSDPGVEVRCTNTWYFNPDGTVAFVQHDWFILRFRGKVTEHGAGEGCASDLDPLYLSDYDPYASGGDVTSPACDGTGGAGGGTIDPDRVTCHWEWMQVEISYDGGVTWETYWSGWANVCELTP